MKPKPKSESIVPFKDPEEDAYITQEKAEKYARDAGMAVTSARLLRNCGKLGEYIEQIGVVKIGRSKYAWTIEKMEKFIERAEKLTNKEKDPDMILRGVRAATVILKAHANTTKHLIESAKIEKREPKRIEVAAGNPSFPPAVQFNILNNANAQPTKPAPEQQAKEVEV